MGLRECELIRLRRLSIVGVDVCEFGRQRLPLGRTLGGKLHQWSEFREEDSRYTGAGLMFSPAEMVVRNAGMRIRWLVGLPPTRGSC